MARYFDHGFNYHTASYGPRLSDPSGQYVSLVSGDALAAAEKAAASERDELPGYCDTQCGDCCLCQPDLVVWGEEIMGAKELFSPHELRAHRHALLRGETVCLDR